MEDIKDRKVLLIPEPKYLYGPDGQIIKNKDGVPIFIVKSERTDYEFAKPSPVKQAFHDKYVIAQKTRCTITQLAVLYALAKTTTWAEASVLVDDKGNPILNGKHGKAIITKLGNVTATRTIYELEEETGLSYGAVQKALRFWENEGVLTRLDKTYKSQSKLDAAKKAGRPVEFYRYEIDPIYVWNGYIWLGLAYGALKIPEIILDMS